MRFLLDTAPASSTQWILPVVLLVLVIGIFVLNYFRNKKNQENMKSMVESLKVGDNVKTYSGMYGRIIEIIETTDGKMVVLETGSDKNKGIFSIDINAVFSVDPKEPVVEEVQNVIKAEPEKESKVKVEADKKEVKKAELNEKKNEESKKEVKPKKTKTETKPTQKTPKA